MIRLKEPGYETKRLKELKSYNILDSLTEQEYENITYLASIICNVPVAVISFVDENRQWFKSHHGLNNAETLKEYSFCAHAINSIQEFLIVPDSRNDPRFFDNPLVTGDTNIVFYAGVPLINENGYGLGTVCVIDNKPRELSTEQLNALRILSTQVMKLLETRKANTYLESTQKQLEIKNRDLEESKNKLEKSETRLRIMSEGTDVLIAVTDEENDTTFFTKAWSDLTGKSIEELLLFGWTDSLHPDDRERYLDTYLEAFENRTPYSVEFRLLNGSGDYTWLLSQGSPQLTDKGTFAGYISSTTDISARKQTEADLAITTRTFELALEAGKVGTFELNLKSGTLKTSTRYKQNFGLKPDDHCNFSSLLSMIVTEDRASVHQAFIKSTADNVMYDVEYRIKTPAGEVRWIHASAIPAYNDAGEAVKMSGVSVDITAQKTFTSELERQVKERTTELNKKNLDLENINKELESFTYISSHDLQEPLRKIQTFADRIIQQDHDNLSETGQEYFKRILYAAGRMKLLIQDLLEYSHSTSSERIFENVQLGTMIEAVIEDLKEEIQQKQGTVDILGSCDVKIIRFQFKQLLLNIFSNSIKFSQPGSPLHIKITCEKNKGNTFDNRNCCDEVEYNHISISDNGIGFNQQFSEKIFELFQRLNSSSNLDGTGIGLSIVKKIVENHNGFISATGAVNEGATFDIYLPVVEG